MVILLFQDRHNDGGNKNRGLSINGFSKTENLWLSVQFETDNLILITLLKNKPNCIRPNFGHVIEFWRGFYRNLKVES